MFFLWPGIFLALPWRSNVHPRERRAGISAPESHHPCVTPRLGVPLAQAGDRAPPESGDGAQSPGGDHTKRRPDQRSRGAAGS